MVLGDLVTDVVAVLAEPLAPASDAAAAIARRAGGAGGNVAARLAELGAEVTFVGRVGDDPEGRALVRGLADLGLTVAVTVDAAAPTGTVIALVAPGGERTMVTDRGANLALTPADLPVERFAAGSHLHLSGYALLHPAPRVAAIAALELARAAGMTISVDPASAAPLAAGPARFLDDTAGATWCLPNLDEARLLTGQDDQRGAALALTRNYREVVVTLGAQGACWSDGARWLTVPARPARVVDATGAGDAFAAGFLHARLGGAEPAAALSAGAALAARAVGRVGAR